MVKQKRIESSKLHAAKSVCSQSIIFQFFSDSCSHADEEKTLRWPETS